MMNPVFDQFTEAVDNYVNFFHDKDLGRALVLGKILGFMDFNLTEEQMTKLMASIKEETTRRTLRQVAAEMV
jgi:hypothetical protein